MQGHVDYCSQLFFPNKSSDMEEKKESALNIYKRNPRSQLCELLGEGQKLKKILSGEKDG